MNILLEKAIKSEKITKQDIEDTLYEICQAVHASCDEECPVFDKNEGIPWNDDLSNCKCFCNGKAMLEFLK